jgi:hypothetical protein
MGRSIIYTELDILRIGSSDWVLWALKPKGYINMGNCLPAQSLKFSKKAVHQGV